MRTFPPPGPFLAAGVSASLFFLLSCSPTDPRTAGTTSGGNPGLTARLVYPDGSPAAGAVARLCPRGIDTAGLVPKALAPVDSAAANGQGVILLDSLDSGVYVLQAEDGAGRGVRLDSVAVADSVRDLGDQVLMPCGSVAGVVYLSQGGDPSKVLVLAPGLDRLAVPDSLGRFLLDSLLPGSYSLLFFSTLDQYGNRALSGVRVDSGAVTRLDTVKPAFTGVPLPKNLRLGYDTLKQIVSLSWDPLDASVAGGCNVYRRRTDTSEIRLTPLPVAGTVYNDSTAVQDCTYVYRVAAVDSAGTEGAKTAGDTVCIRSAFTLLGTFGGPGTRDGQFTEISDIKCLKNGNIAVLDMGQHRVEIFDSSGKYLFQWGKEGTGNGEFEYPIALTEDDSGNIYIVEYMNPGRVQKFTVAGLFIKSWIVGQRCRGIDQKNGILYLTNTDLPGIKTINIRTNDISQKILSGTSPKKIVGDSSGYLYVSDDAQNSIIVIDANINISNIWGGLGDRISKLNFPWGLSIITDRLFVADYLNTRVQVFTKQGSFIAKTTSAFPSSGVPATPDANRPVGITVDTNGDFLVTNNCFILKYAGLKLK